MGAPLSGVILVPVGRNYENTHGDDSRLIIIAPLAVIQGHSNLIAFLPSLRLSRPHTLFSYTRRSVHCRPFFILLLRTRLYQNK